MIRRMSHLARAWPLARSSSFQFTPTLPRLRSGATAACFLLLGVLLSGGCEEQPISANDQLIARVDALLAKNVANQADREFLSGLTDAELERVFRYYDEHPREMADNEGPEIEVPREATTVSTIADEILECEWGYGGWVASGWFHTTACGGDAEDHYFLYPGVPNAYADRGRLRVQTVNPGVWLVFQFYKLRNKNGDCLLSRVYSPANNVYVCVGKAIHTPLGVSHEQFRTSCFLYKR